jgi:nicotinamide riboside kinase
VGLAAVAQQGQRVSGVVCIAVLGAESTGKTTLTQALQKALAHETGKRVACVGEVLREWCDNNGRTPLEHEQAPLIRAQHERIDVAALTHDIVVCDTTALMTAAYSELIFADRSLRSRAVQLHRRMSITLLTALDLPWVPDGHQRDGPHMREPVDNALRELLLSHRLPFAVINGAGETRLQNALLALQPLWREPKGLFTGLKEPSGAGQRWACECCVDGDSERALRQRR